MSCEISAALAPFLRRLSGFAAGVDHRPALAQLAAAPLKRHARGVELAEPPEDAPEILAGGWLCRIRRDASRGSQILGFTLPGEAIGSFWRRPAYVPWRHVALTHATTISGAAFVTRQSLQQPAGRDLLTAARRAEDHAQHLAVDHMVRLGGRDAYAGLVHLLLEFHSRLHRAGLAEGGAFHLPVGQRVLAAAMGFSVAHTNQTLQRMVADGLYTVSGDTIHLRKFSHMCELAGFVDWPVNGREPDRLS